VRHLGDFPSAVLTGVDDTGYPFSARCRPEPDGPTQTLRLQLPASIPLRAGPAGLLCHRHDAQLWNLKSFWVRGSLGANPGGWTFHPQKFVPGAGIGGPMGVVRFIRDGRRRARQYLKKRGLARPEIPWDRIHAVWQDIERR
jgi:hypothetical protein